MENVILAQVSREDLKGMISDAVSIAVEKAIAEVRPKYLTRQELADTYKVSLTTVHDWVNSGKLKAVKIGGRVLFPAGEVTNAVQEKRILTRKRGVL